MWSPWQRPAPFLTSQECSYSLPSLVQELAVWVLQVPMFQNLQLARPELRTVPKWVLLASAAPPWPPRTLEEQCSGRILGEAETVELVTAVWPFLAGGSLGNSWSMHTLPARL